MNEIVEDTDGDGLVDQVIADLDGDGVYETASFDTNRDGYIDAVLQVDPRTGATIMEFDTDFDGETDLLVTDADGDGLIDEVRVVEPDAPVDPDAVAPTDDPVFPPEDIDTEVAAEDLPTSGEEGVHGDPRADIEYHTVQPGPVDCLPTSVSMVVSEITGEDVPAEDVVALANDRGFMGESGMIIEDSLALLTAYGVDAEIAFGDADALRGALDAGDEVIIALDSADLYAGDGGPFDSGLLSGHAVVLTGIDDGPPAYVYINDPGFEDGSGVQVSLELFMDAWEDADYSMIVAPADQEAVQADSAEPVVDEGSLAAADGDEAEVATPEVATPDAPEVDLRRVILLPITLLAEAITHVLPE